MNKNIDIHKDAEIGKHVVLDANCGERVIIGKSYINRNTN